MSISPAIQAAAITDVAEIASYQPIYQLDLQDDANYEFAAPVYGVDNSGITIAGGITRVGYYLELDNGSSRDWLWASFDAFTQDLSLIGVPHLGLGAIWQQSVSNMNVESNVGSIVTGTGITTGNIEFWGYNYLTGNAAGVPNASNDVYDTGDQHTGDENYGSMQIHNNASGVNQTLFAYNRWGRTGLGANDDVGIGNNPVSQPDWTFEGNAANYSLKSIEVWVSPPAATAASAVPVPAAVWLFGSGLIGLITVARRNNTNQLR